MEKDFENESEYNELDEDAMLAEIEREIQMKEMMDNSCKDLQNTLYELEMKLNDVDKEGNEWKTRYETQLELNQQLERELALLKSRLQATGSSKKKNIVDVQNIEEMSENNLKSLVRQLEKEKIGLDGQLRDMEWRLDQESKAFHKASEGRRKYMTELNEHSFLLNSYKKMEKKSPTKYNHADRRKWPARNQHSVRLPPVAKSRKGK